MGPRKDLPTGYQERLEILLRTLLRVEGGAIGQRDLSPQGRARQQEISDSKLLRVLQEREFERLGSLRTLRKAMMLVAVGG